ncbi:MAG: alpha/beta fold hydrolase [Acidobacteria bacterium]|nr:alpha/beta fold hydrolase [Acidobacteriota bacterium]
MGSQVRISVVVLLVIAAGSPAAAQETVDRSTATPDLSGHWEGEIALPGAALQVMLDFERIGEGETAPWRGTIDIPAQSAVDLPLEKISLEGDRARFSIAGVPGVPTFAGTLRDGELTGDFTQGAARLSFRLGRDAVEVARRTQDPQPPLPYREEEVTYASGEVTLAGTLTLPPGPGPFPAAVLVSGSGPQNRDEEIFNHRPFRVLADALARRGIAVLRSDDRGVGGSSGDINASTTSDFADDALAAVALLGSRSEIAAERIGIIGHSEGGLVGPLAAVRSDAVAYVVLLAGPGVSGGEILPLQNRRLAEAAGGDPAALDAQVELVERMIGLLRDEDDEETLRAGLHGLAMQQLELGGEAAREALGDNPEAVIGEQIDRFLTPWFRYFLNYDPRPTLRRLRVPVLALVGTLDLQVDAEQNLPEIERALTAAGNEDFTALRLDGLNHLFQHATTGAVIEYGQIEETMAPEVLELIGDWITQRFAG